MKKILITILLLTMYVTGYSQFSTTAGVGIGGNLPYGDFKNLYTMGVSVEGVANYGLPVPGLSITLTTGYNTFNFKNDYINTKINQLSTNSQFNESWTLSDIPFMIGVKYIVPDVSKITPYGTAEVGINILSFSSRISGDMNIDSVSGRLQYPVENKTQISPGLALGIGTELSLLKVITFDLSLFMTRYRFPWSPCFSSEPVCT